MSKLGNQNYQDMLQNSIENNGNFNEEANEQYYAQNFDENKQIDVINHLRIYFRLQKCRISSINQVEG